MAGQGLPNMFEDNVRPAFEGDATRGATRLVWLRLRHLLRMLRAMFPSGGSHKIAPNPVALADEIVLRACDESVDWGRGNRCDYPNKFEVSVSREAWDSYFGQDPRISERVAVLAAERMGDSDDASWAPHVFISCSDLLPCGDYEICASFERREKLEQHWDTVSSDSPKGPVEDVTPPLRRTAMLRFISTSYHIVDGNTLGVVRSGRESPDIVLPTCADTKYTSCIQGSLEVRDGHWVYVQQGKNGSRISGRNHADVTLSPGESFELHDRDRIWLPKSTEPILFVDQSRADDGTLYMPAPAGAEKRA